MNIFVNTKLLKDLMKELPEVGEKEILKSWNINLYSNPFLPKDTIFFYNLPKDNFWAEFSELGIVKFLREDKDSDKIFMPSIAPSICNIPFMPLSGIYSDPIIERKIKKKIYYNRRAKMWYRTQQKLKLKRDKEKNIHKKYKLSKKIVKIGEYLLKWQDYSL